MKDKVLLAGIIGGVSVVSGEIVTAILVWFGVGEYPVFELNSMIVTINRPSFWMGLTVNAVIGTYVGVVFYLIFMKLGSQHAVVKCTFGGLLLWLLFEMAFAIYVEGKSIPIRPISDYFVHLAGTAAYGATVGSLFRLWLFGGGEPEAGKARP